MKGKHIFTIVVVTLAALTVLAFIAWYVIKPVPNIIQGEMVAKTIKVSSKLIGRVDSLPVSEGQSVRKGQLLYVLSTPEVQAKLTQAEGARMAASALESIAMDGARRQEKEAAYNMWQAAEAALTLAQKTYDRVKNLYEAGVVPAQKYDEALATLKAARNTAQAARARYSLVESGARSQDKEAARGVVQQATGAVTEVESYLSDSHQYSPIDGEVSTIIAEKDELVNAGYPVVTLIDLNDMWASFNIKETYLPRIRKGDVLNVYVPALDRRVEMEVTYIAVEADFATWSATRAAGQFDIRTFEVRARPVDGTEGLRPGMSVLFDWNAIEVVRR